MHLLHLGLQIRRVLDCRKLELWGLGGGLQNLLGMTTQLTPRCVTVCHALMRLQWQEEWQRHRLMMVQVWQWRREYQKTRHP